MLALGWRIAVVRLHGSQSSRSRQNLQAYITLRLCDGGVSVSVTLHVTKANAFLPSAALHGMSY